MGTRTVKMPFELLYVRDLFNLTAENVFNFLVFCNCFKDQRKSTEDFNVC